MRNRLKVSALFSTLKDYNKNWGARGEELCDVFTQSLNCFPPCSSRFKKTCAFEKDRSFRYRELRSFCMQTQEWKLISWRILSFLSSFKVLHGIVIFLDYQRNFHMMIKIETAAGYLRAFKFEGRFWNEVIHHEIIIPELEVQLRICVIKTVLTFQ